MLEVIEITAAQSFPLRAAVLRAGIPINHVDFGDQNAPGSRHFGAFWDGELVGAGYISPIAEPDDIGADSFATTAATPPDWAPRSPDGWQLRGMSVAQNQRGRGIGRAVLLRCIEAAREENTPVLWCNARVRAVSLYERAGFVGAGEIFEIAGIGPHLRMRIVLNASPHRASVFPFGARSSERKM